MWPDSRLVDLLHIEHPLVLAPMAGAMNWELAAEVSAAGGLGSLPCAMLSADQVRDEAASIRTRTDRPFALNFFAHTESPRDEAREAAWMARLAPYYAELGLSQGTGTSAPTRAPFDERLCDIVEEVRPVAVSFHFGLPAARLVERLKRVGVIVMSTATTVAEARWLEDRGIDAIVAQGFEAGGHRGMFLSEDVSTQVGTLALVPQVVDAVRVPVVAAGGIADGRAIVAALALGASGVQIGTAYLHCPEATISAPFRAALQASRDDGTAVTNAITGRPARAIVNRIVRELGPMNPDAPAFPHAATPLMPLRAAAESHGSGDFSPMWSGQAAALGRSLPAAALTRQLIEEAQERIRSLARSSQTV